MQDQLSRSDMYALEDLLKMSEEERATVLQSANTSELTKLLEQLNLPAKRKSRKSLIKLALNEINETARFQYIASSH